MKFSLAFIAVQNIAAYSEIQSVLEKNTILILGVCLAIALVILDQLISLLKLQDSQHQSRGKGQERVVVYIGALAVLAKMLFDYLS